MIPALVRQAGLLFKPSGRNIEMVLTLDRAKQAIDAAVRHAKELYILSMIAIVDENGWLVALHKMDGALIPTVDIARDKAWTAAVFKIPSSDISKFGAPSSPGLGLNTANWNDRLTIIPGGLPIKGSNGIIGGVGVSGGTPEEDISVCQAAIANIFTSGSNKREKKSDFK